jgi:hypothetical protein
VNSVLLFVLNWLYSETVPDFLCREKMAELDGMDLLKNSSKKDCFLLIRRFILRLIFVHVLEDPLGNSSIAFDNLYSIYSHNSHTFQLDGCVAEMYEKLVPYEIDFSQEKCMSLLHCDQSGFLHFFVRFLNNDTEFISLFITQNLWKLIISKAREENLSWSFFLSPDIYCIGENFHLETKEKNSQCDRFVSFCDTNIFPEDGHSSSKLLQQMGIESISLMLFSDSLHSFLSFDLSASLKEVLQCIPEIPVAIQFAKDFPTCTSPEPIGIFFNKLPFSHFLYINFSFPTVYFPSRIFSLSYYPIN